MEPADGLVPVNVGESLGVRPRPAKFLVPKPEGLVLPCGGIEPTEGLVMNPGGVGLVEDAEPCASAPRTAEVFGGESGRTRAVFEDEDKGEGSGDFEGLALCAGIGE